MPKATKTDKKKQAETKILWITTIVYVVLGSIIFAVLTWARVDKRSEPAAKIREIAGIEPFQLQTTPPDPEAFETVIEPAPEPEPEPEPLPEPVITEATDLTDPEALEWNDLISRPELWPKTLKIMVDQEIQLTYKGNSYGEIQFTSGQLFDVDNLSENGYISGETGGLETEIHASETSFSNWFEEAHGDQFEISLPEKKKIEKVDGFEQELIAEMRMWSMLNYKTPLIEFGEDKLILRMNPADDKEKSVSGYSLEALSVARAYLRIQAKLGGNDNYASCEIRDPNTGELLGSKGMIIPRF